MWQITISHRAEIAIENYVRQYATYFLSLFDDTGLWSEQMIRENYIRDADKLGDSFYDTIYERLSQDILPYEISGENRITMISV
jgi:hypothetical protein